MAENNLLKKPTDDEQFQNEEEEDLPIKGTGGTEYKIDKNKYHQISCSEIKDEVYGRYFVNASKPLPQFDSKMAKAYSVTDKQTKDSDSLYAMVLSKSYPIRIAEINKLLIRKLDNFTNIIAAQILPLSLGSGRFYTVIIERPQGIPLSSHLNESGPTSEEAVISKIITPISQLLSFFEKKHITHGRINLENIYIDSNAKITVCECVSEICGYSQDIAYENAGRASSTPIAKGVGKSSTVDHHALGVAVAILLHGKNPFEGLSEEKILNIKFIENTYKRVTEGMDLSPYMSDFLRGTINDKNNDIWGSKYTSEWIKGRRFNLLPQGENIDAGRPIIFNKTKYWSKKLLAYEMYREWKIASKFVLEDTLIRWVERSVQDPVLSEKMELIFNHTSGGGPNSTLERGDEILAQYIMALDPNGPLRLHNISAYLDGIGPLLAHSYETNNQEYLESIRNIIGYSIASARGPEVLKEGEVSATQEAGFILNRCTELFRKKYMGFNLERCLYELNHTLPCQSDIIKDYVCLVVPDLLISMDRSQNLTNEIVDLQIAAFIAMQLELPVQIRIKSLSRFADYAKEPAIQNTSLLSFAQERFRTENLPNLSMHVVSRLNEVIETFHSRFVREDLRKELNKVAEKGSLPKILEVIANTDFLVRDKLGFRKAVMAYRNNTIQIIKLSNRKAVNNMGYRYGLQLSVLLSFFIATIVIMVLVLKIF